ncbi:MAG: DUF423 domain-containing protein [Pseudomonadota bacterium]
MLIFLSAICGLTAVTLGAFGAHALGEDLSGDARGWWDTATLYLMVHAVAALAIGLSSRGGLVAHGGLALLLGAILFAATLYAMALGAPRWFGAITPIGGLGMLAGWALIAIGTWRS